MNLNGNNPPALPQSPSPSFSAVTPRRLAGFWRRTGAFLIDIALLSILGILFGFFMFDRLAQLGCWGHFLGFVIAACYFAILDSSIGNGQSLGKKLLRIQVVGRLGNTISFLRAFLRYSIMGIPFFLNNAIIPTSVAFSQVFFVIGFIVFGLGGALLYLYVFNRQTRQSIHDVITGTYVVHTRPPGPVVTGDVWKPHYAIVCAWCVIIIAAWPYLTRFVQTNQTLNTLLSVQQGILRTGKVHYATASVGKNFFYSRGKKWEISYVQVQAILKKDPGDPEKAANEIATIVLARYPKMQANNALSIVLRYGYDIGISQSWRIYSYSHTVGEWQKILHATTL